MTKAERKSPDEMEGVGSSGIINLHQAKYHKQNVEITIESLKERDKEETMRENGGLYRGGYDGLL